MMCSPSATGSYRSFDPVISINSRFSPLCSRAIASRAVLPTILLGLGVLGAAPAPGPSDASSQRSAALQNRDRAWDGGVAPRWWRGNTHTHTLWSDGDAPPDLVAKQYKAAGYHFLILSDHNVLSRGERWFPVDETGRLTPQRLEQIESDLGREEIVLRGGESGQEGSGPLELRLATLAETRARFEEADRFLLIEGEEITDSFEGRPIHVNGLNLSETIPPQGGTSFLETVQRNFDAVSEQGRRLGRPTLAHLNHPNFQWAIRGASDFVALKGPAFLEIYNGHPATREAGDGQHLSVESLWDEINIGRAMVGLPLALGIASDDSHHHFEKAPNRSSMGRGWITVRSPKLEANSIIEAVGRGDFYASCGVELEDLRFDGHTLTLDIDARPGLTYRTIFIGATRDSEGNWAARILATTASDPAVFELSGRELFVRARVTSSRFHPNPQDDAPGPAEHEQAWTQPVQPRTD